MIGGFVHTSVSLFRRMYMVGVHKNDISMVLMLSA